MSELITAADNMIGVFSSKESFETGQRMANLLASSTLVPKEYQKNSSNCLIALEVSGRIKASPLMVMQNLYIVYGKPSWSSQFVISAINACGRFKPLQYEVTGNIDADNRTCIAWTTEHQYPIPAWLSDYAAENNLSLYAAAKAKKFPILESPAVSIELSKKEGWYQKNGSKWQTMPELMLRYRSASFFGRLYAPDVLMGMYTAEEVEDMDLKDITPKTNASSLNEILTQKPEENVTIPQALEPEEEIKEEAKPELELGVPVVEFLDNLSFAKDLNTAIKATKSMDSLNALRVSNTPNLNKLQESNRDLMAQIDKAFTEQAIKLKGHHE